MSNGSLFKVVACCTAEKFYVYRNYSYQMVLEPINWIAQSIEAIDQGELA